MNVSHDPNLAAIPAAIGLEYPDKRRRAAVRPPLPADLADVALIDGATCAAVGDMSLSWWHAEVAAGRAPAPAIRESRCARWLLSAVRDYWAQRAAQPQGGAELVMARARKATAAARAARAACVKNAASAT